MEFLRLVSPCLLLTALLLSGYAYAQRAAPVSGDEFFLKRGAIGAEAGVSIPVMDFASTQLNNSSGFASPGYSARIHLSYEVLPLLGLRIQYTYNQNGFDEGAYLNRLQTDVTKASRNDLRFDSYTSGAWVLHGLSAGLFIPLRTTKTTYTVGAAAGFFSATLPGNELDYYVSSRQQYIKLYTYEGNSSDPAYQFSIGVRTRLSKDLLLSALAEFMYSEQSFKNLTAIDLVTMQRYRVLDYKQYYHILNISAGLAWQFN